MITIELDNGQTITPSSGLTIKCSFYNPAFDPDRGERTYIYPMMILSTAENNIGMDFYYRLDGPDKLQNASGKIKVDGITLAGGNLKAGINSEIGTEIEFVSSGRYIQDHLDKIMLSDVVESFYINPDGNKYFYLYYIEQEEGVYTYSVGYVGLEIIIDTLPHEYVVEEDVDFDRYDPPESVLQMVIDKINADYPGLAAITWLNPSDGGSGPTYPAIVIIGGVITYDAINPINLYYTVEGRELHEDYVDWVNDVQENDNGKYVFPTIYNPNYYEGKNEKWTGWINPYPAKYNTVSDKSGSWEYTYTAMLYFRYVMEQIRQRTNISNYTGSGWDIDAWDKLILYNDYTQDLETDQNVIYKLNQLNNLISGAKVVPEISCAEFLNQWLSGFALYYVLRGSSMIIRKNVDQLSGGCADWTHKCEPEYSQEKKSARGFVMDYVRDGQDGWLDPNQLTKKIVNPGDLKIDIPWSTLYMSMQDFLESGVIWVPSSTRPCTSDSFGTSAKTRNLKFLWYNGMANMNGVAYPLATHGRSDGEGTIVNDISLGITDADGVYESFWKEWAKINADDITTVNCRLSMGDIKKITKWENPKVTVVTDEGQVNLLIKELHISISNLGLGISEVVGVRLR